MGGVVQAIEADPLNIWMAKCIGQCLEVIPRVVNIDHAIDNFQFQLPLIEFKRSFVVLKSFKRIRERQIRLVEFGPNRRSKKNYVL